MAERNLNYPANEINTLLEKVKNGFIKSASVAGNNLTLTDSSGTRINFSPSGGGTGGGTFFANSSTTFDQIKRAYDNGLVCFYDSFDGAVPLNHISDDSALFIGFQTHGNKYTEIVRYAWLCTAEGGWTLSYTTTAWDSKQDLLVSGTNIKTINGKSLLGAGNITIEGGGSGGESNIFVATYNETTYDDIQAALAAGKCVIVRILSNSATSRQYMFADKSGTTLTFTCPTWALKDSVHNLKVYYATCQRLSSGNTHWSNGEINQGG